MVGPDWLTRSGCRGPGDRSIREALCSHRGQSAEALECLNARAETGPVERSEVFARSLCCDSLAAGGLACGFGFSRCLSQALLNRRKVRALKRFRHSRADRIEVHVIHACENRAVVEKRLALEAAFPETTRALVFLVCPTSDVLVETPHEPANVGQSVAEDFHLLLLCFALEIADYRTSISHRPTQPTTQTLGLIFIDLLSG